MAQNNKIATVFGGTGFLGTQVVRELAALGYTVKVATRIPESAYFLKPCGVVGQVVPFQCDYGDTKNVCKAVKNADVVVNCIGVLYEKGKKSTFKRAHVDIPAMIAKACADEGASRFVHVSALSCDKGTSKYAKSKLEGEQAIHANYPKATILRPSVMFGAGDNFFNMFAELARYSPFLPLIGGGKTRFQPVYVGDVADAVIKVSQELSDGFQGKVYQLGGVDVVDFKDIYAMISQYTGRERRLVKLPFCVAKFEAMFLALLPKPLLTRDQVESLKTDNVVEDGALNFKNLGIVPVSMASILPSYLERYRSGGVFSKEKAA
ncbi:MAG: complex I NDUFA9 subunit family protein [Alphaproteobacteria bacterium]